MSLGQAGLTVLVVVLALLYLGLARLYYDVRQLRRLVLEQMTESDGAPGALRLPVADLYGRTVLSLSTSCDWCWTVLEEARAHAGTRNESDLVVLTHENPGMFAEAAGPLPVVQSAEAWSVIAHLSPPVLLRVGVDGLVDEVVLPAVAGEVTDTLRRWAKQEVGR